MAAAPLLLFPSGWHVLALAVLPLIWLGNRLALGYFVRTNPYNVAVLLLLLMVLVSLYATYDLAVSAAKIAGIVLGVGVLYGLLGYVTSTRQFEIVLWCVVLGSAGFTALAIVGTDWGQKIPLLERIGAWLPAVIRGLPGAADGFHPAEVGGTLTWLIFLPISFVVGVWPRRWRVHNVLNILFGLSLALLMAFVLLLTQSRSAWLGTAIGAGLFLLLAGRGGRLILGIGLAVTIILVVALGPDRIASKLQQSSSTEVGMVFNPDITGRTEIWSRAIYGIGDFSFTGMGLGTFRYVVRGLYPLFSIAPGIDIGHAHNELLQAGVDLGLPGLIAFISLQLLAFGLVWRAYRGRLPRMIHWGVIGVFAGLVAHTIFGLTDAVALGAKPGLVWWLLLGLVALSWQAKQRVSEDDLVAAVIG